MESFGFQALSGECDVPTFGLVCEGIYDTVGISTLIRRIHLDAEIESRPCGGKVGGKFIRRLRDFQYLSTRLDKALVVADAHGKEHIQYRADLMRQIAGQAFPFPVECIIIVEELESLMLADPRAIEAVCVERGKRIALPDLTQSPEAWHDAKARLENILSRSAVA